MSELFSFHSHVLGELNLLQQDFGDVRRAVGAYERGIEKGDCGSTYRLAMAYLLGQIGLTPDSGKAIALLKRAADTADLDTPQRPSSCFLFSCPVFVLTDQFPEQPLTFWE